MQRTFTISAHWDADVKRWYSESDIVGLHIEAATLEEFESVMRELAVEMIFANHFDAASLSDKPIGELVPAILWKRPEPVANA